MRETNITIQRRRRSGKPTRRNAAYDRPADGIVFPEQFFDSRVKLAAVCPETALMYAVLEDAFLCFHKQGAAAQRDVESREARDWFFSESSRRPFSFLSVCDALGLEPTYIRHKLRHWTPPLLEKVPETREYRSIV